MKEWSLFSSDCPWIFAGNEEPVKDSKTYMHRKETKFYCLRQGTPKRDKRCCGEVIHDRPTNFWNWWCKQAQNSAFAGQ